MLGAATCRRTIGVIRRGHDALIDVIPHPGHTLVLINGFDRTAYDILADDFLHAESFRKNTVRPQRRNVSIAFMASENGQEDCAEHIGNRGRVWTFENERAMAHPGLERAGNFQEIDEKGHLAERRQRRRRVPFDPHGASERVECDRARFDFACWASHGRRLPPARGFDLTQQRLPCAEKLFTADRLDR